MGHFRRRLFSGQTARQRYFSTKSSGFNAETERTRRVITVFTMVLVIATVIGLLIWIVPGRPALVQQKKAHKYSPRKESLESFNWEYEIYDSSRRIDSYDINNDGKLERRPLMNNLFGDELAQGKKTGVSVRRPRNVMIDDDEYLGAYVSEDSIQIKTISVVSNNDIEVDEFRESNSDQNDTDNPIDSSERVYKKINNEDTTLEQPTETDIIYQNAVEICDKRLYANQTNATAPENFTAHEAPHSDHCSMEREGGFAALWIALFLLLILFLFIGLAIICDDFFIASLEAISEKMNLSEDVAGATFMAAGSSAPELFISIAGAGAGSDVGVGTIVGSAVFNLLIIIALTALLAGKELCLDWRPFVRDSVFYGLSIVAFILFSLDGQFHMWESLCLLLLYAFYIVIMKFNAALMEYMKKWSCCNFDARIAPEEIRKPPAAERVASRSPTPTPSTPVLRRPDSPSPATTPKKWASDSSLSPTRIGKPQCQKESGSSTARPGTPINPPNGIITVMPPTPPSPPPPKDAFQSPKKAEPNVQAPQKSGPIAVGPTKAEPAIQIPKNVEPAAQSSHKAEPIVPSPRRSEPIGEGSRKAESVSSPSPRKGAESPNLPTPCTCVTHDARNAPSNCTCCVIHISNQPCRYCTHGSDLRLPSPLARCSSCSSVLEGNLVVTGRANSPNNGCGVGDGGSSSVARCLCHEENKRRSALFEAGDEKREMDVTFREGAEVQLQQSADNGESVVIVFKCLPAVKSEQPARPVSSECLPGLKYVLKYIIYMLSFPWACIFTWTVPKCDTPQRRKWYLVSFFLCIAWIAFLSWIMILLVEKLGCLFRIDSYTMGLVVVAMGTSVPDAMSSVMVAQDGFGDMAVSNALGSNVFDINLGLGLPFFLGSIITSSPIKLMTPMQTCLLEILPLTVRLVPHVKFGVILLIVLLVAMLIFTAVKFRLRKSVAVVFLVMYAAFMIYAFVQERKCYSFFC